LLETPTHMAGASMNVSLPTGTTVSAGVTYLGESVGLNFVAMYSCFAGTGPCLAGPFPRPYRNTLPSIFKVNGTVSQQLTPLVSGFVSGDNLTNNTAHEFYQTVPVMGRITTVGVRLRW
jgi:hypothetical protein